jgi:hypothetical protein
MAEAIMRTLGGNKVEVHSSGIRPSRRAYLFQALIVLLVSRI